MSKGVKESGRTGLEAAVIGMAGKFPGATNCAEFWINLKNGLESIAFLEDDELIKANVPSDLLNSPDYIRSAGGVLEDEECFDAPFFDYTPREAELMDPQLRALHECAWEALEDAGYDPLSYKGFIGLYAGASANFYWEGLSVLSGKEAELGQFVASQLIQRDFLCTRVAYKLNLKGPSSTVQTACSTSLVAIHQGCRSLLTGECKIVLAGGVSIADIQKQGYVYQEGMILSADGHCRAFDVNARGTVGGSGVGIVVLKLLTQAIADRDHIYAVIKGSAINNDGNRKVGFTAPSVEGQAEVVKRAQHMARIDPGSIGYIEAHGSATPLGDSIEVAALKRVFNNTRKGGCAIGSVKTNVGHLDAAAGVASFIKTVLALEHRQIPPSLHFESPHPQIDFKNSPFYVNTGLKEWADNGYPLRAGVSSFGIGGTNVHLVLEEASEYNKEETSTLNRDDQLILLSARTAPALERTTERLVNYLKACPSTDLVDVAYTLQVGRRAFKYRRKLLCSGIEDAIKGLSSPDSRRVQTSTPGRENRPVIFMFSGLGGQYVNMGRVLYDREPVFREEVDRCFEILSRLTDCNLREILYPGCSANRQGVAGDKPIEGAGLRPGIEQIEIAQSLVFIIEYALAKLLMKWGIKPYAMIGYSFGEYAAAQVSGVFSLEDALRLITARGKLIQGITGGRMLSVPLARAPLTSLLSHGLSIAIDNGTSCIVAGPESAVDALEKRLAEKRYLCLHLGTRHAIHSRMMAPILEEFRIVIGQLALHEPRVPYISNVTGRWITVEEATDPDYWVRHLRETVRFAEGVNELVKIPDAVFVEIGPGRDLSTLVLRSLDKGQNQKSLNLIRPAGRETSDGSYLLNRIGQLWLWGLKIDWEEFYSQQKRYRLSLPTYPFEHKRYRMHEYPSGFGLGTASPEPVLNRKPDMADWFYVPQWKRSTLIAENFEMDKDTCWLVFQDDSAFGRLLVAQLEKMSHHVVVVRAGSGFARESVNRYIIHPREVSHYEHLFKELVTAGKIPDNIVHCWGINAPLVSPIRSEDLERSQDLGLYSLINLAWAVGINSISKKLQIGILTSDMQQVTGEERVCPEKATILGPVKVIPLEYVNIACKSIDITHTEPSRSKIEFLIDEVLKEFAIGFPDNPMVAYRGRHRWCLDYEPVRLNKSSKRSSLIKERGTYLITGGLGGMGFALAEHLGRSMKARLILVDTVNFPPREDWDEYLAGREEGDDIRLKIQEIRELEHTGAEVLIYSADISNHHHMKEIIGHAESRSGQIDGVIHTAGLIDYAGVIQRRTRAATDKVLAPKLTGTLVLDRILTGKKLDFFVLFSSLGNLLYKLKFGQVGYNAGNEFLDAFAFHKQGQRPFTVSIAWNDWRQVGMAVKTANHEEEDEFSISPAEGVEVFHRILEHRLPLVAVCTHDLKGVMEWLDRPVTREPAAHLPSGEGQSSGHLYERPELNTAYTAPRNEAEQVLADIWESFFGINKVGIHDDFFELGGDSLKGITIIANIHKKMDIRVPLAELFKSPTISELSKYIHTADRQRYRSIDQVEKKEYYSLSSAQQRLYVLQQIEPQSMGYNIQMALELVGKLNREKLREIFIRLIKRHESLRTSFEFVDDKPLQRVHQEVDFAVEYGSLNSGWKMHDPVDRKPRSVQALIRDFIRPFALPQPPLMRLGVIQTEEERHILVLDMHHIVTDGLSMTILVREFMILYRGGKLPPIQVQYRDYSEWQRVESQGEAKKIQESYWLKQFAGEIPVLNLPLDYRRPKIQSFEGGTIHFTLSSEDTKALQRVVRGYDVTLYMLLLALYNIFLSKICGQEDIVVGTPTAGRRHADLQQVVGMFVNTLALRNYPSAESTFTAFLGEVKQRTLEAFENQEYPLEELVERVAVDRDVSRNPIFDTMLLLGNIEFQPDEISRDEVAGLKIKPFDYEGNNAMFDLSLAATETEENLFFAFQYCTKLFRRETIERFIAYFRKVILEVAAHGGVKISRIDITPDEDRKQILYHFNDTCAEYPQEMCIHELFEDQALKTPDRIALAAPEDGNESAQSSTYARHLSYRHFNERCGRMAGVLQARRVKTGHVVGVVMVRSLEMMIGIFAILKAGGAYLPIDPQYPQDRIGFMLADSRADLVVTDRKDRLPPLSHGCSSLVLADINADSQQSAERQPAASPAYVIYTSGSTGNPKGTLIEHTSVVNLLLALIKIYPFCETDTYLFKTPYVFDVSISELFGWFLAGGRAAVLEGGGEKDPQRVADTIEILKVSHINFVPSMFSALLEWLTPQTIGQLTNLKYIFLAGEALPAGVVDRFRTLNLQAQLENIYGPTEATVYASRYPLSAWTGGVNIPIGRPLRNTSIHMLNQCRQLQPLAIPGELCIAGAGVARGYLNNPELTAEKFVSVAAKTREGSRSSKDEIPTPKSYILYRTGDLARWLPDGNIEFLGRIDHQVKIRGFRIELGEIEALLLKHPAVKETIVALNRPEDGEKCLVAYVVRPAAAIDNQTAGPQELKEYLSKYLPDYMIPFYFVELKKIPLTPSGKIDRRALPGPALPEDKDYEGPGSRLERQVTALWSEVLGLEEDAIGLEDNFFELGGHSLKAVILVARIHRETNVKFSLAEIFKFPTIRGQAKYIKGASKDTYVSIEPVEKKDYYVSSSAQKRLYILQQMEPGKAAYNITDLVKVEGEVDRVKFEEKFRHLIQRHDSLRTSFAVVDEEPVQKVHDRVDFAIEYFEAEDEGRGKKSRKQGQIVDHFIRSFDLSRAPLLRVGLIRTGGRQFILMVDMHHIVSDGVSLQLFINEFILLYRGKELPRLVLQYKDYAEWQEGEKKRGELKRQEQYWLKEFSGQIPLLTLPTDYERPAVQSFEGSNESFELDGEATGKLKELASRHGATRFMVILSLYYILLSKLSGQEDIVVGTPAVGRRSVELENIIGMFVNTLALRNYPCREKSFQDFLREVKSRTLAVFDNQDYQFDELKEKVAAPQDASRNPLFDVLFQMETIEFQNEELPDLKITEYNEYEDTTSKFDLYLYAVEIEGVLKCNIEYCTRLFKPETIEMFIRNFKEITGMVVKDPGIKIKDIRISHDKVMFLESSALQDEHGDFGF